MSRGNFGTSPTPVQLEDKGIWGLAFLLIGATIWRKPNKGLPSNIGPRGIGGVFESTVQSPTMGGLHKGPLDLGGGN